MLGITLGSIEEFHTGVHTSLRQVPPPGVTYDVMTAIHTFLWDREAGLPFDDPHLGEFVSFDTVNPVHSARWPVFGSRAWITDLDDFASPVFVGRYGMSQRFEHVEARMETRSAHFHTLLRSRVQNMAAAFADESCKGILFRSAREIERSAEWLRHFGLERESEHILAKSTVLYPAVPAIPQALLDAKWANPTRLRVLYCGRHFEKKNGRLAVDVLARLANTRTDVHVTYVGEAPDEDAESLVRAGATYHRALPHAEVQALLQQTHVLFHPARSESLGVIFMEAMAHGTAVICARGDGMHHVGELFPGGDGAVLIERNCIREEDEPAAFETALAAMVQRPGLARRHGTANHRRACAGPLSFGARDKTLLAKYSEMVERPASRPLRPALLPVRAAATSQMRSSSVMAGIDEAATRTGRSATHLLLSIDL